ncbi:MAG: ABC transporter ATP-binding protein [Burkholderiaceae bacterium]
MASRLQIDCLSLHYQGPQGLTKAVDNLSIDVGQGDIACLVGPSGCGKSSLLRAIAGFVEPSLGRILIDGRVVTEGSLCLPPEQRGVGMVFQDYALFPHLTVQANILFGLTRGRPKDATASQVDRAKAMLDLVGLSTLRDRMPHELSGGQA